jgi:hypothetical protein
MKLPLFRYVNQSKTVIFGGHSTTTRTKFGHYLTAPGQFLYPERGQNRHFLTTSPHHLVHVIIEWPLSLIFRDLLRRYELHTINLLTYT